MKSLLKHLCLFTSGGSIYTLIELLWRTVVHPSPTHWTMFILGGLCFIVIGAINEFFPWDMSFIKQTLIGTSAVLILEFIFGYVLNIKMGLHIWDYSELPLNLLGQICLPFAFIWVFLVAFAIVLDDYMRYWLFSEEKPRYKLW